MLKRVLLASILWVFVSTATFAAFAIFQTYQPPLSFIPTWQDLRMGAGGLFSWIATTPSDGTMVARTDTYGGYIYKSSGSCTYGTGQSFSSPCWQQLFTATSLPSSLVNLNTSGSSNMGAAEIAICDSNTDVLYAIYNGKLLVTVNRGATWVATTQTTTQNANSGPKDHGPFLACDPKNPDILYMGVNNKLVYTINGRLGASATFTTETDVGTTGSVPSIIAFDPSSSSGTCGGVTCSLHLFVYTSGVTGVYETSNGGQAGGGSFTLRNTSAPANLTQIYVDKFSQLWAVNASSNVYKYVNGTGWSTIAVSGSNTLNGITTDPASSTLGTNKVIAIEQAGKLAISTNNGSTFSNPFFPETTSYTASGLQPGWLGTASQASAGNTFTTSHTAIIDNSSKLWMSGGISIWTAINPAADSAITFSANSVGTEQLVTNQIISPVGCSLMASVWDRGIFTILNPDIYPSVQYTNSTSINQIEGGWGIDFAANTTGFASAIVTSNIGGTSDRAPAKTTDCGNTWSAWSALPTGLNGGFLNSGGSIAVSTTNNWIVVNNAITGAIYSTQNGSTSWTAATITGSPAAFSSSLFNNRQPIAADRVTSGTFYAVDINQKFFSSSDGGLNWSATGATSANVDGTVYRDQFVSVPGNTGHVFYTSGGGLTGTHPFSNHLWKSTDGAATFSNVNVNLKEVTSIGFGASKPGGSGYPSIYVIGWLSGVQGIYASFDSGSTWALINVPSSDQTWPMNSVDLTTWLTGDADIYGRINVGFLGSGGAYIDTADACPWIAFDPTTVKPNQALTGSSVTLTAQHSGLVPVTGVKFFLDGTTQIGATQTGQSTYSVSFNASAQTPGAHTLTVRAEGNGCTTSGNSKTIPITTS